MFSAGQNVFFFHPQHSWVCGSVVKEEKGLYTCKVEDPKRTEVPAGTVDKVKPVDMTVLQIDTLDERPNDLLSLTILHDATLLRCLYLRYMEDIVYTNIGAIVVAFNPFNYNIDRYKDDKMKSYLAEGPVIQNCLPHSWAQAHNTYWEMINDKGNQCILISGESGAGKTEAAKIVMKYLAEVSCSTASGDDKTKAKEVGVRLQACSPILESFGNAKTVRNDNSSRFGKFSTVKFTQDGRLAGALTTKYLLEKSRVVTAAQNERIYHSFYILVRGKFKGQLGLENESLYKSLNAGNCTNNKEFNSPEDFDDVCSAMKNVGMSDQEVSWVWLIPAAVMCLQNVGFVSNAEGKAVVDESQAKFLQQVVRLWEISEPGLRKELTTRTLNIPGQGPMVTPMNVAGATDSRDALCKGTYDGVFAWLVDKCNELCDVTVTGNWVGLLDIFGFEDFEKNSFEQMCINLANETLQNHYNGYIFNRDMEECKSEGIDVTEIKCPDNSPCLKLVAQQGGIIPLLDSQCAVDGTDAAFLADVFTHHGNDAKGQPKNPFLTQPKMKGVVFIIHHYAGSVTYDTTMWLEKNRDTLRDEVRLLLRSSPNPIVKVVLPAPIPLDERKGKGNLTVGGFFKNSLQSLMDVINSTNPHWIRCVKPHPAKKPKMVDGIQSMKQLESSGVLGTVKIRKAGYPIRLPHEKFIRRYNVIAAPEGPPAAVISGILGKAEVSAKELSQVGKTKVFMKSEAYQKMERRREFALADRIVTLQRFSSGLRHRKKMFNLWFEKHRAALLKAKREREEKERAEREAREREQREAEEKARLLREAEERRRLEEERRLAGKRNAAATMIQRHVRGWLTRSRIFREVLEMMRARFESKREDEMQRERASVRRIDQQRIRSEHQWTAWLTEVDHVGKYRESERQRLLEKYEQKLRIQKRELCRVEQNSRDQIAAEQSNDRYAIQAKCFILAKHKLALSRPQEDARQVEGSRSHRRLPSHETLLVSQPGAEGSFQDISRKALGVNFSVRANAWEDVQKRLPKKLENAKEFFERSKRRWECRTDTGLESLGSLQADRFSPAFSTPDATLEHMYSGPFRSSDSCGPVDLGAHSSIRTPKVAQTQHSSATDWSSVFREK